MLFVTVVSLFATVVWSVPHLLAKRQLLNGTLAGLQGVLGQNASFGKDRHLNLLLRLIHY